METILRELVLNEVRAYSVFANGRFWDHRFAVSLRCEQLLDLRFNRTYVFPSEDLTAGSLKEIVREITPVPLPFRMDTYLPVSHATEKLLRQERFKVTGNFVSEMILEKSPALIARNPNVRVERLTKDLIEAFSITFLEAYETPSDVFSIALSILQQTVPRTFEHAGAMLYLAYLDSRPVGVAYLFSEDGVGGIYNVGVVSEARKQGVARALMLQAVEDSRAAGNATLCLQTRADSFQERFYEQVGFTTVAHRNRAIRTKS